MGSSSVTQKPSVLDFLANIACFGVDFSARASLTWIHEVTKSKLGSLPSRKTKMKVFETKILSHELFK